MTDMHRVRTAVYSASISELPGAGASDHRFSAPGEGSRALTVVFVGDVLRPAEFGHVPGIGPIVKQMASPDGHVQLLASLWEVAVIGSGGHLWSTGRLSDRGLRITSVTATEARIIIGEHDDERSLVIDLTRRGHRADA